MNTYRTAESTIICGEAQLYVILVDRSQGTHVSKHYTTCSSCSGPWATFWPPGTGRRHSRAGSAVSLLKRPKPFERSFSCRNDLLRTLLRVRKGRCRRCRVASCVVKMFLERCRLHVASIFLPNPTTSTCDLVSLIRMLETLTRKSTLLALVKQGLKGTGVLTSFHVDCAVLAVSFRLLEGPPFSTLRGNMYQRACDRHHEPNNII